MTTTDTDLSKNNLRQSRLETLIAAHLDMVYASALRQVNDSPAAEDITQTVFLIAAKKYASIPHDRAGAWLLKVTRYVVLNLHRSEQRRRHHERHAALFDHSGEADAKTEETRILAQLDAALHNLSAADRELIARRFFQNQPIARIAQALRTTENTASKRLSRALDRLREKLKSQGISAPAALLPTILSSTPNPKAPSSLAPKILHASTTPAAKTLLLSLGILLMSTATKWTLAVTLALLLLMTGAFLFFHNNAAPTNPRVTSETANTPAPESTTTTLTGTLKDTAGNPISNAFVSQGFSPFARAGYHYTYTDSDGHFAIPNVHIGDNLMLTASAHGYSPQIVHYGLVTANTPETPFTLSPGHIIRFRFLDQHNQPLSSVVVAPDLWQAALTDLRTNNFLRGANGNPPYDGMLSGSDGRFAWNSAPSDLVDFAFYKTDKYDDYRFVNAQFGPSDHENTIILRDSLKMTVTAVDDQTNAPIPDFNCFIGQGDDDAQARNWDASPKPAADGKWSHDLTDVRKFNFIRVEAPGYAPVIKSFPEDLQSICLPFRLSKSAGLTLTVLQPNNQPAIAARVYIITNETQFDLYDGDPLEEGSSPSNPPFVTTDDQGQCRLADPAGKPARLLIFDDAGFAEFPATTMKKTSRITLQPWAEITGQSKTGTHPAPSGITISMELPETPDAPKVQLEFTGNADKQGNFSFSHVLARPLTIFRNLRAPSQTRYSPVMYWPTSDLTPAPGQILSVTLGGTGQLITGRFVAAGAHAPDPKWILSIGEIDPPRLPFYTPQESAELATLTPDQKKLRLKEIYTPERVKAYTTMRDKWDVAHPGPSTAFVANPDGTFYADCIPPGDRVLTLQALDPNTGKPLAAATLNFTAPPTPTTQPIDLGEIPMQKSP